MILFGSYAAGISTHESDIDLLIVTAEGDNTRKKALAIRQSLANFASAVDIVVVSPSQFLRDRHSINHIVYFADRYGKVVYEQ